MGTPLGIKLVSVLFFLAAAFFALFGFLLFFGAGSPEVAGFNAGVFLVLAVVSFVLGSADAAVGWGLLKRKGWARLTGVVLLVLGIVGAGFGIAGGELLVSSLLIVLYAFSAWYLLFNSGARHAFVQAH